MASSENSRLKISKSKKKKFSSFRKDEAFQYLGLTDLLPWTIETESIQPSDFFQEHLKRLKRHFDLESYEESKKLLIDAICDEAINTCDRLKIWKGAQLESDRLAGYVDYLIAERKRFLDLPLLCIIEAKKDDFEQGLAQCLVELHACQWKNQQHNHQIDVLGIVTNGEGWRFYKLAVDRQVYETPLYSIGDLELLLGRLRYVFQLCQQNLP
ncbi:MAG TPA: hypothetical protein IGS17_04470 [Oscillatoriales cyanobacterium M59_W2019_021]|nr:MAG: hypothetical protein D6728_04580 [Cyanobacteria bacterium J055]HIK32721.1 hypothetical protein [Oscillatoriales cyanobacterium M4454_W2019_049]HIK50171.1 hypothetical protein [Oscillatoriales cyanobacterium M59_W2019_021]